MSVASIYPSGWKCLSSSIYPSGWKYPSGLFTLQVPFTIRDGNTPRVHLLFRLESARRVHLPFGLESTRRVHLPFRLKSDRWVHLPFGLESTCWVHLSFGLESTHRVNQYRRWITLNPHHLHVLHSCIPIRKELAHHIQRFFYIFVSS